jgi:hypothetical protein
MTVSVVVLHRSCWLACCSAELSSFSGLTARCAHVQIALQNFLAALGAGAGQHPYPIYASLLRHACSSKLSVPDCTAVLRVAKDQVRAEVHMHAASALLRVTASTHACMAQLCASYRRAPRPICCTSVLTLMPLVHPCVSPVRPVCSRLCRVHPLSVRPSLL